MSRNNKGQFTKGNPGKPKGSTNKITAEIKAVISGQVEPHLCRISDMLHKITTPIEFIDAISKLLPYIAPKLSSIDVKDEQKDITINVVYKKSS